VPVNTTFDRPRHPGRCGWVAARWWQERVCRAGAVSSRAKQYVGQWQDSNLRPHHKSITVRRSAHTWGYVDASHPFLLGSCKP